MRRCYNCDEVGHLGRDCPKADRRPDKGKGNLKTAVETAAPGAPADAAPKNGGLQLVAARPQGGCDLCMLRAIPRNSSNSCTTPVKLMCNSYSDCGCDASGEFVVSSHQNCSSSAVKGELEVAAPSVDMTNAVGGEPVVGELVVTANVLLDDDDDISYPSLWQVVQKSKRSVMSKIQRPATRNTRVTGAQHFSYEHERISENTIPQGKT